MYNVTYAVTRPMLLVVTIRGLDDLLVSKEYVYWQPLCVPGQELATMSGPCQYCPGGSVSVLGMFNVENQQ